MNARKQLLVVLTALMLVCSSGAMVTAATGGDTVEQSNDVSEDEYDQTDNETTNESDDMQEHAEAAAGLSDGELTPSDNESDGQQGAYVTFEDQTTEGETVVVENVSLASPGFVAIHDSSLLTGNVVGSVIGVSTYLEAGTYDEVEITLDEPIGAAANESLEADGNESSAEGETLIAMPHRDTNDNQTYDFVTSGGVDDVPFLTASGEPVVDEAIVTIDDTEDGVEDGVDDGTEDGVDDGVEDGVDNDTEDDADDGFEDGVDNDTEDGVDDGVDDDTEDGVEDGFEDGVDNDTEDAVDDGFEDDVDNDTEDDVDDGIEDGVDDDVEDGVDDDEQPPMDDVPIDGDQQPVFVTVEDLTVEDVNFENTTVYVLVVGEDISADDLPDGMENITEDELPDEDNETDIGDDVDDNETIFDDNETEDNETDIGDDVDDNETIFDDDETEDNETDIGDGIDDNETVFDDNETEDNETVFDDNETEDNETVFDDNETEEVTAESFNVTDLEAPESATVGDTITVTATVENPTDEERTEDVQFRLDGDLVDNQSLTLESGASEEVEFEVDTSDLQAGSYIHMVLTDQSGEVATLELTEETDTGIDDNESDEIEFDDENETNDTDDNGTDNLTANDTESMLGVLA
ncbi:DUF7282 domain-containing protein [Natrinema salaciae]|uniref:DUF7282 domain-containing protein n=1 Tax=Natrinema salaciae TaxID=1186196 RepID=A0A1H9ADB7_9EURY|nr:hypothetical protein [Natrinema salaciae]SEP74531.1 hypothetical protein SAMN04489841_0417 [Natrinema salaciae]